MKKIVPTDNKPILLWLENPDSQTMEQAVNLASLPFIHHHIAIMPDAHVGYGMPIGGVAATIDRVIPNAVGVDIGCGVCAVQTSLQSVKKSALKPILNSIRQRIPTGFKHHKKARNSNLMPSPDEGEILSKLPVISKEFKNGLFQLGTLGGGNHFIEIQKGSDNRIWIMIHSGSRNIGYQVAKHYNRIAVEKCKREGDKLSVKWQLCSLPLHSKEGRNYLREMNYCVRFAAKNRKEMMKKLQGILKENYPDIVFSPAIDIAHNYAAAEKHFGREVIVHRKGSTRAGAGELGIIPGSQGSTSYIVRGKGNPESFCSCSHGAGRKLGRKQARRQLNLKEEIARLERQNILHSIRGKRDLDEAAGAYKNIEKVMADQQDLVDVVTALTPLAVVKA